MVFWGAVVKPGTPFTLSEKRRLHLSQATLGVGSAPTKSIVQCNVGDKIPIFLCTLVPEKTESCSLNLKYEEADEVVFSVIGSRSVHLTGYYEERNNLHHDDDDDKTESYGEDIADTEMESSEADDDEYGGSFINDDDIEVLSPSPIPAAKVGRQKHRKLKKCRIVESDNDDCSPVTATSKHALPNAQVDETSRIKEGEKLMKRHISEPNNDDHSPVKATPKLFGIFDVSDSEEEDARPIGTLIINNQGSKSLTFDDVDLERVTAKSKNKPTEDESDPLTLSGLNPERNAGMETNTRSEHVKEEQLRELMSSKSGDNLPLLDSLLVELKETVDNGDSQVPKLENRKNDAVDGKVSFEAATGDAGKSSGALLNDGFKIDHKSRHPKGAEESFENSTDELDGFRHTLPLSTQLPSDHGGQKKQRRKKKRKNAEVGSKDVSNEVDKGLENGPESNITTVDLLGIIGDLENHGNAGMETNTGSEHVREGQLRELISSKSGDNLPLLDSLLVGSKETVDNGGSQVPKLENKMDNVDGKASLEVVSGDAGKSSSALLNDGVKIDHNSQHLNGAEERLENSIDELDGFRHTLPLPTQLASDDGGQKKHRRKKKRKTEVCSKDVSNEVDKGLENGPESKITTVDLLGSVGNPDDDGVFLVDEEKSCLESQHKERKKTKRNNPDIKRVEIVSALPCFNRRETSVSSRVSNDITGNQEMGCITLLNGLVIEEQEIGNPDGEIATLGKRVSVHYVVKLQESGQVLHSNLDEGPMKFKLGAKGHDGWELGIEGMRVGGKRRIPVPPSLGLSTEGASGEAALVYDVELVKVR